MSVWVREIFGCVLVGVGLAAAGLALYYGALMEHRQPVGAVICLAVCFLTFRAGMQFLKVATAARAARDVRREMGATAAPTRRVRPALGATATAPGRQRASVVPGPPPGTRQ